MKAADLSRSDSYDSRQDRSDSLLVCSPYTGEVLARLSKYSLQESEKDIRAVEAAFQTWRNSSGRARRILLETIAAEINTRSADLVSTISAEAGKPVSAARAEVDRSATVFRWMAGEAERYTGDLHRTDVDAFGRHGLGITDRPARGVVLAITPYNWPLLTIAHKVAPALGVGCTCLVKPSLETPMTALLFEEIVGDVQRRIVAAGIASQPPAGDLVKTIIVDDTVLPDLTGHPLVSVISFTGSPAVGALIRRQAPDKHVVLELGGNGWVGIFPDVPADRFADIARRIVQMGFGYAGQGCISVQNVAIWHSDEARLRDLLAEETESTAYGDPGNSAVVCGPLINRAHRDRVVQKIDRADGVKLRSSRRIGSDTELLVPPTLILRESLPSVDPITEEEVFGPVITCSSFASVAQFIDQVNRSKYGLQAGIFTDKWSVIDSVFRSIHVGALNVNDVPTLRYDHTPFGGGILDSGQGVEGGRAAMDEMTRPRFMNLSSDGPWVARPLG